MDLEKQFKDLELDKNLEKDVEEIEKKQNFDEAEKVRKELEEKVAKAKEEDADKALEPGSEIEGEDGEAETEYDEEEPTLYDKIQPFILPICLTFFAIVFAALFLYFFSRSRQEPTVQAIQNTGNIEGVYIPAPIVVKPVIVEEKLTCNENQKLNETGDECIDIEPVVVVPEKPTFENGTTTIAHVKFSFDKYNYDNYPRGIYLLPEQIFEGDYSDYKILATNRAFANDHFFGVDRNMVSLIGTCQYVVDDAQILVRNMRDSTGDQSYASIGDNYFRGNVVKVIEASKPHIVCGKNDEFTSNKTKRPAVEQDTTEQDEEIPADTEETDTVTD